ncbi:MAG TPA: hypothetical protein VNS34_29320 [Rhizobiaceae bacterium]|nr:hypothetical protein [Rhizobiaceae bacterium]
MTREADLMARAGNYVLGLMEESDRQRAERDLEIDPAFREAVLRVAERMHLLDLNPAQAVEPGFWRAVAARIGELPQMRTARPISSAMTPPETKVAGFTKPKLALLLAIACLASYAAGLATARFW